MADPTGTVSDGIYFGAQDVVLGAVTWTCSAFSLSFPMKSSDSMDSYGAWRGSAYMNGKGTGSGTLRYPTITGATTAGGNAGAAIPLPVRGTVFAAKTKGGAVVNVIITEVGETQGDDEPTVPISVAEAKHFDASVELIGRGNPPMTYDFSQYPEWQEAAARERQIREAAYLGLPTPLAGGLIQVLPLTLRQQGRLFALRSPLIVGAPATLEDVGDALWLLQPEYSPGNTTGRDEFRAFLRELPDNAWLALNDDFRAFLAESMIDAPRRGRATSAAPVCGSAIFTDLFASAYGWSRDQTLDSPLICLHQEEKLITRREQSARRKPAALVLGALVRDAERKIVDAMRAERAAEARRKPEDRTNA